MSRRLAVTACSSSSGSRQAETDSPAWARAMDLVAVRVGLFADKGPRTVGALSANGACPPRSACIGLSDETTALPPRGPGLAWTGPDRVKVGDMHDRHAAYDQVKVCVCDRAAHAGTPRTRPQVPIAEQPPALSS
jgi:hypothetical protein